MRRRLGTMQKSEVTQHVFLTHHFISKCQRDFWEMCKYNMMPGNFGVLVQDITTMKSFRIIGRKNLIQHTSDDFSSIIVGQVY